MKFPVDCFKCGKKLESAIPDTKTFEEIKNQPDGGVKFSSGGNYGSTVWDPMSDMHTLEINICDSCLIEFKDRVAFLRTIRRIPVLRYMPWNPEEY